MQAEPTSPQAQAPQAQQATLTPEEIHSKKILAGLLGILLGGLGLHKFALGYNKAGVIELILCLITCGFTSIIGFVEGIIYLTTADEAFAEKYIYNKREWF